VATLCFSYPNYEFFVVVLNKPFLGVHTKESHSNEVANARWKVTTTNTTPNATTATMILKG
jgi:hypothetical protein